MIGPWAFPSVSGTRLPGAAFFFSMKSLTIAVTGGVACGKSEVCRQFLRLLPEEKSAFFSCDEEVRLLFAEPSVKVEIEALARDFGVDAGGAGALDRRVLRELLFVNSEFRGRMEVLLHPLVHRRLGAYLQKLPESVRISLIEVPLLYEVDFPVERDLDLVVAASVAVQRGRLQEGRGLDAGVAERILQVQLSMEEKMRRADLVVWNDGDLESLYAQIEHLVRRCKPLLN